MIYTSYFSKLKALPENIIPIAICGKAPNWYTGLQYKKLAPKYGFFMKWKETHDNDYYIEHFKSEVLDNLRVTKVLADLQRMIPFKTKENMECPFFTSKNFHIALICYEKPSDFCHRHLVARWLNESGFNTEEWNE